MTLDQINARIRKLDRLMAQADGVDRRTRAGWRIANAPVVNPAYDALLDEQVTLCRERDRAEAMERANR